MQKAVIYGVPFALALLVGTLYLGNVSLNGGRTRLTDTTSVYVFSIVNNDAVYGEGFFATLWDNKEVFVYRNSDDFDAHELVNTQRKMLTTAKEVGAFRFPIPKEEDVYLETRYELGIEQGVLPKEGLMGVAAEVRTRGYHRKVFLVYYRDIAFDDTEMKVSGDNIATVDDVAMTTGESTYLFTVHMKNGLPLNIFADASALGAEGKLENLSRKVSQIIGTNAVFTAKDLSYSDTIYTTNGVRSGWLAPLGTILFNE